MPSSGDSNPGAASPLLTKLRVPVEYRCQRISGHGDRAIFGLCPCVLAWAPHFKISVSFHDRGVDE